MKNFRTVDWLKDNIDRDDLVILDVRDRAEYDKSHIPNAIYVDEGILHGEVKEHGGRHPLPSMESFAIDINSLGVDDEATVIVYDDGDMSKAGRLWWMLRYIGFKESYVLLAGLKAWKERSYDLSIEAPKSRKSGGLTVRIQKDMIADIEDVKKSMSDDSQVLIDSRSSERYRGEVEPIDKIPGHIPGAVNYPWTDLAKFYDNLDEAKIKEHYKDIEGYDKTIVYCGSGITATVNIMFMEEVGLKPEMYVGSYSDWVSYPENEIEKEV